MNCNANANFSVPNKPSLLIAQFFNFSPLFLGWYRGPRPALYVTDPEFIKEVLIKESETFIDRPMLDRSDTIPHLINLKGNFLCTLKN